MSVEFGRRVDIPSTAIPPVDYKGPPIPVNDQKSLDPEWTEVLKDPEIQRLGAVFAVFNRMSDNDERNRAVNYLIARFKLMSIAK